MAKHNNPDDFEHTIRMDPEPYPLDDLADLLNSDSLSPNDKITEKSPSSAYQQALKQEPTIPSNQHKQTDMPYTQTKATSAQPNATDAHQQLSKNSNDHHSNQASPHKKTSTKLKSIKQLLPISLALILGCIGVALGIFTQSKFQQLSIQAETTLTPSINAADIKSLYEKINQQQQQIQQLQQQHTKLALQQQSMLDHQPKRKQASIPHKQVHKKIKPQKKTPHKTITAIKPFKSTLSTPTLKNTVVKPWTVIIASFQTLPAAQHKQHQLKNLQTSIQTTRIKGSTWYRLVTTGFKTRANALVFIAHLRKQGIKDAWVQAKH